MSVALFESLGELTEKQWELQCVGTERHPGIARQLGWRAYHTLRSKGSTPGFPDWTLLRERVVFVELKREGRDSKLTAAQKEWILAFLAAGAEVYVARPSDLEPLARILACRGNPFEKRDLADVAARLRAKTREECS